jgi:hypothetical protein
MAGRKHIPIDWKRVDSMLRCQAKGTEIAANLGVHPETLYDACKREHGTDFSAYAAQKKEAGITALRVKQFELALKGDRTMLIFLGKQYLGQKDRTEISGPDVDAAIERELARVAGRGEATVSPAAARNGR